MVGGNSALNLSLLSRGIGEIQQNGHEKVEVFLEPEDYFNFVGNPKRIYLPPIQTKYPYFPTADSTRELQKLDLPKTFTTRRGALLLFSEDLAQRNRENQRHIGHMSHSVDATKCLDIKTVDDLAKSILSYGNEEVADNVYLGFVHKRQKFHNKLQIRPGFSAKRYLSTWTRIWDDSLLENVISKGYITERSLFYGSMVVPSLRRRIFHDDLSHYPQPYRLMRNMLISPGSLSGYTFYRMEVQPLDLVDEDEELNSRQVSRQKTRPSIKVIKTRDGVQREVSYSDLDKESQKEVLTDLLVKSAVNYALQKQQEFVESIKNPSPEQVEPDNQIEAFNMKEAVESLLETEKEANDFNKLTQNAAKSLVSPHGVQSSESSNWPYDVSSSKSVKQLPALDRRHLSTIEDVSREGTGIKVLPPIGQGDGVPLLNIAPPTPKYGFQNQVTQTTPDEDEESWGIGTTEEAILRKARKESEQRRLGADRKTEIDKNTSRNTHHSPFKEARSHFSSDTSFPQSRQLPVTKPLQKRQWTGSTHSVKSHVSKRSSMGDGSLKGSLIAAPGGEILRVGGSVAFSGSQGDVANLVEVTPRKIVQESKSSYHMTDESDAEEAEVWPSIKGDKRASSLYGYGKKSVTEEGIVDALTQHAQAIAEHILVQGGGVNLEEDIRKAAGLWMETHPARKLMRSQSVMEYSTSQAIETVMKSQKVRVNSAAPTVAEYKALIKQSITEAVANATGIDVMTLTLDSDISDELLEALANETVSPDEVKVVKDPLTGRSQLTTSTTSLKDGHLYMEPNGNGNSSDRPPVSIPSERSSAKDIGEVDIISYMASETIDLSETVKSDRSDTRSKGSRSNGSRSKTSSVVGGMEPQIVDMETKSVKSEIEETEVKEMSQEDVTELQVIEQEQVAPSVVPEIPSATSEPVEQVVEPKGEVSDHGSVTSQKSIELKKTQSKPVKLEDREEFVVGKVKKDTENEKLYGQVEPPPRKASLAKVSRKKSVEKTPQAPKLTTEPLSVPEQPEDSGKPKEKKTKAPPAPQQKDEKKKKNKKGKKAKKAIEVSPPPIIQEVKPEAPPAPSPSTKTTTPRIDSALSSSQRSFAPSESPDFIIIRDRSPSPEPVPEPVPSPPKPQPVTEPDTIQEESEDEETKLNLISNKDARAAKRTAAAAKRKEEVERKRREREDEAKREREKQDRDRQREMEAEDTRRKQEEHRRLRKQQEETDRLREELESREREKRQIQEVEREKRLKEERARKFEEMKRRQAEEELKRLEMLLLRQAEEEERQRLEEEKKSKMEEEERIEYERRMKEEEEQRKIQEALEKQRREEEAARLMEEERQKAIAEARKRMEIEARLKFNRSLQLESQGLSEHSHKISEAFVFSYFEILQWLGLDIPEFELQKLEQLKHL